MTFFFQASQRSLTHWAPTPRPWSWTGTRSGASTRTSSNLPECSTFRRSAWGAATSGLICTSFYDNATKKVLLINILCLKLFKCQLFRQHHSVVRLGWLGFLFIRTNACLNFLCLPHKCSLSRQKYCFRLSDKSFGFNECIYPSLLVCNGHFELVDWRKVWSTTHCFN